MIPTAFWMLTAYLLIVLGLAYLGWKKRGKGLEDFYVQSRKAGPILAFLTFSATLFSSFTLVGLPGFFYAHGIASWLFVGFADIFMALMVYVIGRRMWSLGKKFGYITPSEFLGDRFGSRWVMVISGIIGIVFLLPYISTQLLGAGILLSQAGLPVIWGALSMALLLLVYSELGGMRTIAWTDALQGIILLVVSFVVAFLFVSHVGGVGEMFSQLKVAAPEVLSVPGPAGLFTYQMMLSFFILIIFMPATQPQLTVRYFLPKDKRSFRLMMIATAVFAFLAVFPQIFIGLGARLIDPALASGDLALPTVLTLLPAWIASLAIVGVIASSMSTADSQILTLSSIVTKDWFVNIKAKATQKKRMAVARVSMLLLLAIAFLIATKPPKLIITLSVLSFAGTVQLLPAMLGALFWKKATNAGALWSMIVGVVVLGLFQWGIKPWGGWHAGILGLAAATIVFVVVSLLTYDGKTDKVSKFLEKEYGML